MPDFVPLVDLRRNGILECRHFGAIAVADTTGRVLAQAGDPHWLAFTRSTLKALQALPLLESGAADRLGLASEQLALLCASHSGEPMHVAQVQTLLDRAGQPREALQCGCHAPIFTELGIAAPPGLVPDARHHNCSGKHAGFLAWCADQGQPVADYLAPGHPLQQSIRAHVARAAGLAPEALATGTDGCSAPNYAMPLAHLARAYARLASGARDAEFGASFARLADAMTAHPELVSGQRRNDLAFMRAGRGDWVAKIGADGMQAIGSRSRGQAFALKIADGNKAALHAATVEVLEQLGWLDDAQRAELEPWRARHIVNARARVVGSRDTVFVLERPAG
ncbi:asparaginase [Pseudorhodoferax sp.]|uniref:asparaginase n=1 Tax=Pseudorhodoferax sp. TaxID=1993553 RepID=UPI002DD61ACF|nr:asparaginase [Pseudorhodoferax sp.]